MSVRSAQPGRCRTGRWALGGIAAMIVVASAAWVPVTALDHALPGPTHTVDPALAARLHGALDRAVAASGVPGAQAAVILADGSMWTGGAGISAPGQPMTPDLLMAIASVSKLYTAALTLDLAADDVLSLDDRLDRWVPDAPSGEGVTIRQLLTHTSGIASDDAALERVCDPGTCHSYSNSGYRYLGLVIERATGATYAKVLRQRLLAPAGLASTFHPGQERVVGDPATGYAAEGEVLATDAAAAAGRPGWQGASGGLVATAADTARFAHALFTGSLLQPAALASMLDFEAVRGLPGTDDCMGAGMNVWRRGGELGESWSVGGNAGSFRSWVEHFVDHGVTVAAITNSDVPATSIVEALAREVVADAPVGQAADSGRCDTDIAVRSADGSVRLVTTDPGFDGFPSWSPDGSRLAWVGLRDGQQDILIADESGSGAIHLTDDEARDLFPRWSPDGASIAFASDRDGDFDIYLIKLEGGAVRQLTDTDGDDLLPAWSPDGTLLAYVRTGDGTGDGQRLHLMAADGSRDRALTAGDGRAWWPAWSPDGRRLAYEADGVILTIELDGGDPVRLPIPQIRVTRFPAWAPGSEIVFSSDGDLYATGEQGAGLRRLTATSTLEEAPAWSPDGSTLAFQVSHWLEPASASASAGARRGQARPTSRSRAAFSSR